MFPLTDEELDELNQFLLDAEGIENAMDVSTLDGFFAALLSGPATILPSEWLRWVWDTEEGQDSPAFSGNDEAQRIMDLMMRHMNDIAMTLQEAPGEYEPLLFESRDDGDPVWIIDEWCVGFMKGVSLDAQGWLPVTAGHPDWMSTMVLYGTEEGWDLLEQQSPSGEVHRQHAEGLADAVRAIHAFFLEQRQADAASGTGRVIRRQPVRRVQKIGRNEACPCGSGKKYKHCHGDAKVLH